MPDEDVGETASIAADPVGGIGIFFFPASIDDGGKPMDAIALRERAIEDYRGYVESFPWRG